MTTLQFHSILPDALRDVYSPSDLVTFSISVGMGRALLNGSLKLEGALGVSLGGNRLSIVDDVRLDPELGAHALLAEVNTISDELGVIEQTGASLSRAVKQLRELSRRPSDLFSGSDVAALRSPDELLTAALLRGTLAPGQQTDVDAPNFSFSPVVALNRASGPVAFSKTGRIRVTVRLATVQDALFGGSADATASYGIINLRLTCQSVPDSFAQAKVTMRGFATADSTVQTRSGNVSTRLPAVCSAITVSMIEAARRSAYTYNTAVSERPTGITQLVLQLNDTVNGRVSAPLHDEAEMLRLALAATGGGKHNAITPQALSKLRKFHIGYPLGTALDLSAVPFNIQITADAISNQTPWVVTIIGHSIFAI